MLLSPLALIRKARSSAPARQDIPETALSAQTSMSAQLTQTIVHRALSAETHRARSPAPATLDDTEAE